MEQRVSELEEENVCLRHTLNLPPANRPPLGKGPTGKDKPKSLEALRPPSHHPIHVGSRESLSVDSPSCTRVNSLSPFDVTASMRTPPRTVHIIESGDWEQSLLLLGQYFDPQLAPPAASRFPLPSVPSKTPQQPSYPNSVPSSTRNSVSNFSFMPPSPHTDHSHSGERQMGNTYSPLPMLRNDARHKAQTPWSYKAPLVLS
jgi:hypothetical protein